MLRFKQHGGVILNTASVEGTGGLGWGRATAPPKGRGHPAHPGSPESKLLFGIRVNAICRAAMPMTGFMAAGGLQIDADQQAEIAKAVGGQHPLGRAITAENTAPRPRCIWSRTRHAVSHGVALPVDGGFVAR